tara:strand:- start:886 stop:1041 length:156 start_codon:yes stop_codon:yes gene_type:complete
VALKVGELAQDSEGLESSDSSFFLQERVKNNNAIINVDIKEVLIMFIDMKF